MICEHGCVDSISSWTSGQWSPSAPATLRHMGVLRSALEPPQTPPTHTSTVCFARPHHLHELMGLCLHHTQGSDLCTWVWILRHPQWSLSAPYRNAMAHGCASMGVGAAPDPTDVHAYRLFCEAHHLHELMGRVCTTPRAVICAYGCVDSTASSVVTECPTATLRHMGVLRMGVEPPQTPPKNMRTVCFARPTTSMN